MKKHFAVVLGVLAFGGCSSANEGTSSSTSGMDPTGSGGGSTSSGGASEVDCTMQADKCYVRVKDGQFTLDGKPYKYMGTNLWAASYMPKARLTKELDTLQGIGVKNLRIMALSEGGLTDAEKNDKQYGPQRITPASSDSPCADATLEAYIQNLKATLDEVHAHGMKAVMTLNDWYAWSGGMPQYMKWAHDNASMSCAKSYDAYVIDGAKDPATGKSLFGADHHVPFASSTQWKPATGDVCAPVPVGSAFVIPQPGTLAYNDPNVGKAWDDLQDISTMFLCNKQAQTFFFDRAAHVIEALKDHPGVMAWQLANEPRSFKGWNTVFSLWVARTAKFIKDIDPNHLVSIGSEGELYQWGDYANSDYRTFSGLSGVDYLTFHVWPENWGWYDPSLPIDSMEMKSLDSALKLSGDFIAKHLEHARALKKPLVVEEFGLARDDNSSPVTATVKKRNAYYAEIFKQVQENAEFSGVNFWAWGGSGRPATDGNPHWRVGQDYIGDPPHEQQGWYSVYDSDKDTMMLIQQFAMDIEASP